MAAIFCIQTCNFSSVRETATKRGHVQRQSAATDTGKSDIEKQKRHIIHKAINIMLKSYNRNNFIH